MAMDIRAELARRTDETNAAFVRRLLPELPPQTVLGVRTPELRALAKQDETAVVFLERQRLDVWTHNMTVRKATGSRRIPPERKAYLRTLRRKAGRDA